MKLPTWARKRLPWLLAVLAAIGGVTLTITSTDDGQGHKQRQIIIHVDRSGAPGIQPQAVTVPATVVQQAGVPKDATQPLADASPQVKAQVPAQIKAADQAAAQIKATLPGLATAGASIEVPGCRTLLIHSYSSRHGVRPVQFWLHYTASPNIPGWGDVLSIVHYFEHVQASAHFVIDREGNCAYIVPIEQKAWTQMAANPFGINFEIIDRGNERSYLDTPGYRKLASVLSYLSRITGIPIRLGGVSGCAPTRSGIVTHWMGGLCSGGHVDLKPFDIGHEIGVLKGYMQTKGRPAKKVAWVKHRREVHAQYQRDCATRAKRHAHTKECAGLRARARLLDHLIGRKR